MNNAGVEEINDFVSVTEEQYDKIMSVNLRASSSRRRQPLKS